MNLSVETFRECKTLFDGYNLFMKNKVVDSQNKVVDWISLIKVYASIKVLHQIR
jgi:hypothetical protein